MPTLTEHDLASDPVNKKECDGVSRQGRDRYQEVLKIYPIADGLTEIVARVTVCEVDSWHCGVAGRAAVLLYFVEQLRKPHEQPIVPVTNN